ncbi:LysR family transcriptional regulator [Acetobacter sacchari]|uniref:LysR family transcriptional regulator n=1 Tax=Acetobacter sacchari TaxID=2661687 RepID=A0ABS3LSA6_9PROT|nr:LysR family transcriptional regulator [Acetobacter sacchari]MBO1358796.1 LysR family transcriptional regulator [Acetobacter sacchari]
MPRSQAVRSRRPTPRHPSSGFAGRVAEVDLRLLRVFASVAAHGGFAAAEVALGKSKSAVSIDISSLEKRLNLVLCQRGRSGFALTPAGAIVLDATQKLFADLDAFQKRVNDASGTLTGRFSLYLPDTIQIHSDTALLPAIERFATRYAAVHLDVHSASPREVEFAVRSGAATAGITLYPQQRPEMQTTALFQEASFLYCGRGHPFFSATDGAITRAMLASARMIAVSEAASSPRWDDLRNEMNYSATAENIDSRALLILSGVYIGFLPELFAAPMEAEGRLRRIPFDGLLVTHGFYLLTRPSPETQVMIDAFRAILDEVRP